MQPGDFLLLGDLGILYTRIDSLLEDMHFLLKVLSS